MSQVAVVEAMPTEIPNQVVVVEAMQTEIPDEDPLTMRAMHAMYEYEYRLSPEERLARWRDILKMKHQIETHQCVMV